MFGALFILATALQTGPGQMIRDGIASPRAQMPVSSLDQSAPPEVAQGSGPRGTSGEQRYDAVGYAGIGGAGNPAAITVSGAALTPGSFAELTSLDTGRTIVALVVGQQTGGGSIADLSPGAARALGVGGGAAIRVRSVLPNAQDQGALRSGQSASQRIDAPQALLVGLRKRLPAGGAPSYTARQPLRQPEPQAPVYAERPPVRQAPRAGASYAPPGERYADPAPARAAPRYTAPTRAAPEAAAPEQAAGGGPGWYVQVATLSSPDRATALASSLGGGRIVSTGNLHRVQIGPYANATTADQARDAVIRRGYGDARVIRANQ